MLSFKGKAIYLACGATDMRNDIDGLASVVQNCFRLTPTSDSVFIFCNSGRDRLKILEWDGDGFWLHYKRLERGKFPWPDASGGEKLKMRFDRIDFSGRQVV